MSVDEAEDPLDAIVGAALKAMSDSGAPRARLGAFAASFREEVAEILGRKPPPAPATDLLQLVTHAVRQVLAEPGLATATAAARAQPAKRIYVTVAGRATSVTLPVDALRQLDEVAGGRKQARAIIQQLADSAPDDVPNRSGWIQERMLAVAAAAGSDADGGAAH